MATITQRNGTYKITVSCGYDVAGKQIRRHKTYKPASNMTKKQIEKELQRQAVLFEEQCQGNIATSNIKFEVFAEQWFKAYAEKELKAQSIARYNQYKDRVYQGLGHLRLDRINSLQIQKFIDNLCEDGLNKKTGGKLSPITVKHHLAFISSVFSYAVSMNMIQFNPCKNVSIPKIIPKERNYFTLEETQEFLNCLQSAPLEYQVFFTLAIYGGFRKGELLGLEWQDIDFNYGIVSIKRTSMYTTNKGIYTDTPKTKGSKRSLKLPDEVMNLLKHYRNEQTKQRFRLGDKWINTNRLFTNWNGKPMCNSAPYNWLNRFCKNNNLKKVSIHSFRHLNASLLINNGVDARTVSYSLGHSNTSTTLNIYSHTFEQAQAKASEAVANAINFNTKKQA